MTLTYEGRDQGWVERTGIRDTDDPVELIREFWPHGWRMLVIRDARGVVVGMISKWKGRRTWMALQPDDPVEVRRQVLVRDAYGRFTRQEEE